MNHSRQRRAREAAREPNSLYDDSGREGPPELKGTSGQGAKLRNAQVAVAGLGAVGGPAGTALARAGIGKLLTIDPGYVRQESVWTQASSRSDVGRPKAQVISEQCRQISPSCEVCCHVATLQQIPWFTLANSQVLLLAGDNKEMVAWSGDRVWSLGVSVVQGAVDGESQTAIVRVWPVGHVDAPCPGCVFSEADWLTQTARYGCDPALAVSLGRIPTRTLPTVCIIAAMMAAHEVLKLLLEQTDFSEAFEVTYCLLTHRLLRTRLLRNQRCPAAHQQVEVVVSPESPVHSTLAELLRQQQFDLAAGASVSAEQTYSSFTLCTNCGARHVTRRFAEPNSAVGRCHCGQVLYALALGQRETLPAADVAHCLDVPLSELGLHAGRGLCLAQNDRKICLFLGCLDESHLSREGQNEALVSSPERSGL